MSSSLVDRFESILIQKAPYMQYAVSKCKESLGANWEEQFEETLEKVFKGDEKKMEDAARGYVRYALEQTKLQKRFEKERKYISKSYENTANTVYHNQEYMNNLYLPGILISHYLWTHYFHLHEYFNENFVSRVIESEEKVFCEVGVGTGYYSRQMLSVSDQISGTGFDISQFSLGYAKMHMEAFGFSERWHCELIDVLQNSISKTWPFLICVEVLEHFEDPIAFLKSLREILRDGGTGFITAAITAPQEDHIYLYNNSEEVKIHLNEAGFQVINFKEIVAYKPKNNELVPRLGAFIVK